MIDNFNSQSIVSILFDPSPEYSVRDYGDFRLAISSASVAISSAASDM